MENLRQSRREFIKKASAVSAGAIISPKLFSGSQIAESETHPFCVFTKCLQFLDYDQLGDTLADIGFKGADLSVRDKGHVLPENVKTDLPKAIKALQKSGVSVPMMVTGIKSAEDPFTETILGTAADLGVRHYRMGYISYDHTKSISDNLNILKKTFENLEKINRKFGIQGCYQNHQGSKVGGPVWDIYSIIKDCDPEYMGVQYDIRHAVVEGAGCWPLGMKLLSPWITNTAIKDFYWKKTDGKWKITNVPLGEGMIDFDAYLEEYVSLGISGPITIHYEYDLGEAQRGSRNPTMSLNEISDFMKKDLIWLKNKYNEYGILDSYI
ncbi:MAG: TIM barrel protein [Bacteroidales bacterium]|nr:TIM barrel protein [Bacteroidales bacterium]